MSDSKIAPKVSRPEPSNYFMAADSGRGLLEWQHVTDRMLAARNYWVATSSAEGRPHCMPVWGVWNEPEFVFSTGPTTRKARNLGQNPWAVVHLENGDELVVVEGPAREIRDPAALRQFLTVYNPKYEWDFTLDQLPPGSVFSVRVHKAFAWLGSEPETFTGTATRWVFPE